MEEMKALLVEFGQNILQEMDRKMDQKIQKLEAKMEDGFQTVEAKFEENDRKFEQLQKTILDKQFVFEQEYGKKIDLMYDAIITELDKNQEKSEKIRKLGARTDRCEMSLFDHEKRISVLERS